MAVKIKHKKVDPYGEGTVDPYLCPAKYELIRHTGMSPRWWMEFIGKAIAKGASTKKIKGLTVMDRRKDWMADLAKELRNRIDFSGCGDGNILRSCIMALVLTLWYSRLGRAKSWDPKRKDKKQLAAMARWIRYQHRCLLDAMEFEDEDHLYFDQEWESPFK